MSAKPTEPEAEEKVDEVAKQLSETKINEDDAKAKAKADKKARQKAKKMPLLQKVVKRKTNPKENQEVVVVIPELKLKLILHPYRFHNYFPVAIILKAKLWTTQSQMMMPRQNRDLQVKRQEL